MDFTLFLQTIMPFLVHNTKVDICQTSIEILTVTMCKSFKLPGTNNFYKRGADECGLYKNVCIPTVYAIQCN